MMRLILLIVLFSLLGCSSEPEVKIIHLPLGVVVDTVLCKAVDGEPINIIRQRAYEANDSIVFKDFYDLNARYFSYWDEGVKYKLYRYGLITVSADTICYKERICDDGN